MLAAKGSSQTSDGVRRDIQLSMMRYIISVIISTGGKSSRMPSSNNDVNPDRGDKAICCVLYLTDTNLPRLTSAHSHDETTVRKHRLTGLPSFILIRLRIPFATHRSVRHIAPPPSPPPPPPSPLRPEADVLTCKLSAESRSTYPETHTLRPRSMSELFSASRFELGPLLPIPKTYAHYYLNSTSCGS